MANFFKQSYISISVCVVILLLGELCFFRNVLSDVELLFGDDGDGRLTMRLAEHWFLFFNGKTSAFSLDFCYPLPNLLAYSDMMLGFGLIHSLFRWSGFDVYMAYKVTLLFVHLFGTMSMFYLLHKTLKVCCLWSLFGTVAFSFSAAMSYSFLHTQLGMINFLPLLTIFIIAFFRNLPESSEIQRERERERERELL